MSDLNFTQQGPVGLIRFNRPEKKNALGDQTTRHLIEQLQALGEDDSIRVIVITGEGDSFCAGGDFKETFHKGQDRTQEQWQKRIQSGPNQLVKCIRHLPKPVIAAVNGVAVGGGATIALACDVRIASSAARFAFPFARIGLTPEFGCSLLLPAVVGLGNAFDLLLRASFIDAQQALRIGLVSQVFEPANFMTQVYEVATQMADCAPSSVRAIKALLYGSMLTHLPAVLDREATQLSAAFKTKEHQEAVQAFLART